MTSPSPSTLASTISDRLRQAIELPMFYSLSPLRGQRPGSPLEAGQPSCITRTHLRPATSRHIQDQDVVDLRGAVKGSASTSRSLSEERDAPVRGAVSGPKPGHDALVRRAPRRGDNRRSGLDLIGRGDAGSPAPARPSGRRRGILRHRVQSDRVPTLRRQLVRPLDDTGRRHRLRAEHRRLHARLGQRFRGRRVHEDRGGCRARPRRRPRGRTPDHDPDRRQRRTRGRRFPASCRMLNIGHSIVSRAVLIGMPGRRVSR